MKNNKFINGPVNSIRLEGLINNINKTIYLFGDIHVPYSKQTKCKNNDKDFLEYFKENIKNKSINYDLFFELGPLHHYLTIPQTEQKHIDKVAHFFKDSINIDKNKGSKTNVNLRLHYVDFRDLFKSSFNKILSEIYNLINIKLCKKNINQEDLSNLKLLVISLQEEFNSMFKKTENNNKIQHLIDKIKYNYNNPAVKNILINFFKEIKDLSIKFNKSIKSIITFIDKSKIIPNGNLNNDLSYFGNIQEKIGIPYELMKYYTEIDNYSYKTYSYIVDIYFLRRFLDKDYITNGIVYMGIYHIAFYCYVLVKYFNFKITHIANDTISIKKLEMKIKKEKFSKDIIKTLMDKKLNQCSNLSIFPEGFN